MVSMNAEKGQLEATLAVTLARPDGKPLTGSIAITGVPQLEASSRRFYLRKPIITAVILPGLREQDRAVLSPAVDAAVRAFFLSRPVFAPFESGGVHVSPMETPLTLTGV